MSSWYPRAAAAAAAAAAPPPFVEASAWPNNRKLVNCKNCGIQHPVRKCPAFGKACFNCGKLNHYAEFCRKTKQATLNSLLAALKNSSSVLCNANVLKP